VDQDRVCLTNPERRYAIGHDALYGIDMGATGLGRRHRLSPRTSDLQSAEAYRLIAVTLHEAAHGSVARAMARRCLSTPASSGSKASFLSASMLPTGRVRGQSGSRPSVRRGARQTESDTSCSKKGAAARPERRKNCSQEAPPVGAVGGPCCARRFGRCRTKRRDAGGTRFGDAYPYARRECALVDGKQCCHPPEAARRGR
jgi:hypothetical protein